MSGFLLVIVVRCCMPVTFNVRIYILPTKVLVEKSKQLHRLTLSLLISKIFMLIKHLVLMYDNLKGLIFKLKRKLA